MTTTAYRLNRRGRIAVFVPPAIVAVGLYLWMAANGGVIVAGLDDGQQVGSTTPTVTVQVDGDSSRLSAQLNGRATTVDRDTGIVMITDLPEGENVLEIVYDRRAPFPDIVRDRHFVVDRTPPAIEIREPSGPVPATGVFTLAGTVDDAASSLAVGGIDVPVSGTGSFEVTLEAARNISITATDAVGNALQTNIPVVFALPGVAGQPPIRGVHATGYTWVTPSLRDPILEMIADGLINTVELDLKDEAGFVWYDTDVELAHEIGAVEELFVLEDVVADLHALNVRVVGRIVNFRDPILSDYAVMQNKLDMLVLDTAGAPFQQYGGFTNPFNADVREYNIALAEEATALGVDDILYDYVRRPDAPLASMTFPGQLGTPEDAIISFLEESKERIGQRGGRLGASVFGIAATRPLEIAQDIPAMAAHVDYVAPMVYPSHWGPGEYNVAHPDRQPYDIVYRSLLDFELATAGTDATVIAWLQDFSLGSTYGPDEVRAQIDAAAAAGVEDFLLWDPSATYTAEALSPGG